MGKPSPVLGVLDYFETAELALAKQALTLARAIVRRRERTETRVAPKPKAVKKDVSAAG